MKGEYTMIQNIKIQLLLLQVEMTTAMNKGLVIDLCVSSPSLLDLPSAPQAVNQAF